MNETDPTPAQQHPPAKFVIAMITLAVLIFLLAAGMIAFKWISTSEPSAELLVIGSQSLTGAEVSVRSVDEPEPYKSTFGSGGRLGLPFYLGPGSFIIRITQNGEMLEEREVTVRSNERVIVDLSKWERKLVTTQPATTTPTSAYP